MSFEKELKKRFNESFHSQPDEELVQSFNREVGNKGWTFARSVYLFCLRKELSERNIDISVICDEPNKFNLHKKVKLVNKSFVFLEN